MTYEILHLDPNGYADSAIKARQAASEIESAGHSALKTFSGLAHMGGNDEAGGKFAHVYDSHSAKVFRALGELCTALLATSVAFDASAASHAAAEAANAASAGGSGAAMHAPSAPQTVTFGTPASAYGGTNILPQGWTFIQDLVSATWPDGDTDKMRRAATAWEALADDLDSARARHITSLLDPLEGFTAPDIGAIQTKTAVLGPAAKSLADACRDIADLCKEYAKSVVEAHTEAGHELEQFVITSAAAIGISALLTPFTAGISDLVGGGAVAAKAIATAADISETLGTLLIRTIGITSKVLELADSANVGAQAVSKGAVFVAKSAYTGTIWGIGNSMGDYAVNGEDSDFLKDFGMAYVGGSVGEAFDGVGALIATSARDGITSSTKVAESLPGASAADGIESSTEAGSPVSDTIDSAVPGRAGPKHAYSSSAMAASRSITGGLKVAGAVVGTYANDVVLDGGKADTSELAYETARDAGKPSIEQIIPKHAVGIKPVVPLP